MTLPTLSNIEFKPPPPGSLDSLVGFVRFDVDDALCMYGVGVLRFRDGRFTLRYPAGIRGDDSTAGVKPKYYEVSQAILFQVLRFLHGKGVITLPSRRGRGGV